jgi:hypothetical protein
VRDADWSAVGAAVGAAVGVVVLLSVGVDAAPPAGSKSPSGTGDRWTAHPLGKAAGLRGTAAVNPTAPARCSRPAVGGLAPHELLETHS